MLISWTFCRKIGLNAHTQDRRMQHEAYVHFPRDREQYEA